jgi:ubiquinone/menaquinone biosynthesis C-methylase UbiE
MSFANYFSSVQETAWYGDYLQAVVERIPENSSVLDIGTGSGKLLHMLAQKSSMQLIGTDTDTQMLEEAMKKLAGFRADLHHVKPGNNLNFKNNSFDYITLCNVLFLLDNQGVNHLLEESLRVLKENGRILILHPSGNRSYNKLIKTYFSLSNRSILVWYTATKHRARSWTNRNMASIFSESKALNYEHYDTLNGFAQLEIIG